MKQKLSIRGAEYTIHPPAAPLPPEEDGLTLGLSEGRLRRILASQPRLADPSPAEEAIYPPPETQLPEHIRDLTSCLNGLDHQKQLLKQVFDQLQTMVVPHAWSVFSAIYLEQRPYADVATELGMSLNQIAHINSKMLERLRILLKSLIVGLGLGSRADKA
jgi:DNA-directed RNA polymerase specialized sigma24 family protein